MWERIRSNRRRSLILVSVMGVLLITLGYLVGEFFFNNPYTGIVIAFVVWAIQTLVAYYKGDKILLAVSRARKITYDDHPRLYNIVEEMKLASGLGKMPDIYIISDPALNAFAAGRDEEHMAIAITSGLLRKMNRDELQGVIGHEIAHIKNLDILLMSVAGILLGTIEFILWTGPKNLVYGYLILRTAGMPGKDSEQLDSAAIFITVILTLPFLLLIILVPVLARIIYFAISREREYLADASSALYTRYPEGLASALEKIGMSTGRLRSGNRATAPMYIANPSRKGNLEFFNISATHPPLQDRIRILRGMTGISYGNYDESYRELYLGKKGIIPISGLATNAFFTTGINRKDGTDDPGDIIRAREASNAVWKVRNYETIECGCGAKLRVPPGFRVDSITCPRCRRRHGVRRKI